MADSLQGVESIYRVINTLKTELDSNPFCNNVTLGTLTEVDLNKMTTFPMAHMVLENVTHNDLTLSFRVTIYNLDVVDVSKESSNGIYGNDDMVYIWTNQLYVINRLISRFKETTLYGDGFEIDGSPTSDFINKEMENMLAGVQTTLNITVPNNINKC
tara:strand:- start:575 stop:1048 length:474 start_codon:yes stop_codon:yes gene_type:complete